MKKVVGLVIALALVAAIVLVAGRTTIPPDHALVVCSRLGGEPRLATGPKHWTFPLLSTRHLYPLGPRADTLAFRHGAFRTAESEPVGVDLVIRYNLSRENLPHLDRVTGGAWQACLQSGIADLLGPLLQRRTTDEVFRTGCADAADELLQTVGNRDSLAPYAVSGLEIASVHLDPETERNLTESYVRRNPPEVRVVIIGVDGADWDIIDPMMQRGELPNFASLVEQGTRASLESIHPMLSPRIWTSIATGKFPEEHGITDFIIKDRSTGRMVPITSNMRRSKALWNILSDLDLPVGFVGWLATWPAEPVNGFMVSDRMAYYAFNPDRPLDASPHKTYPDELFESLRPLVKDYKDLGYEDVRRFLSIQRDEFERQAAKGYDPDDAIHNFRLIMATTETYRDIGLRQIRKPARLFGLYFELVDAVSHLFVRNMPPRLKEVSDEDFARFRDAVFETYRYQDEILGEILAKTDDQTIVMVLSDHGFRTGANRLLEDPIGSPAAMIRVGHGGRAARAVLDHAPYGILLVRGPGIRSGARIETASVMDIAPTVLYLLGLPVARDMEGRVLREVMEPGIAAGKPLLRITTYETGEPASAEAPIASVDDQALIEKLAALGYVDRGSNKNPATEGLRILREGHAREAIRHLELAVELDPGSAGLWANLGLAHLQVGETAKAENALRKTLEIKPDSPGALSNLAIALTEKEQYEEAASVLEHAVRLAPDNPKMRDNLGVLYVHLNQPEDARRQFARAVELAPAMPEPYNNLGAVALKRKDYDEARAQFERALILSPGLPQAHMNLGRLALETGEPAEALAHLERVLEMDPEHAEVHYRTGLAHRDLGAMEKARTAWRSAAQLDPKGEFGRKARDLLSKE
ncbi:MAG: tetratricopeptide repeat protein [Candidatus Eisenbacteria sp.]|nr:tetratricopeptide repeat protein [Candidatus Eisenbacteria bacterium]